MGSPADPARADPGHSDPLERIGCLALCGDRAGAAIRHRDDCAQERRRGLFRAIVYGAEWATRATFALPDDARLRAAVGDPGAEPLWANAFLAVGATGLVGTAADDAAIINGNKTPWTACRDVPEIAGDCPSWDVLIAGARLAATPSPGAELAFEGELHVRGTGSLALQSHAREFDASISAPWPHPSFVGAVLPSVAEVTGDRFAARWQVAGQDALHFWPSTKVAADRKWEGTSIGVDLLEGTSTYQMITRAAKYGLLLVVLSFATYLFFELLSQIRIHPMQYGLLGLSLSLFALLLLSFGEVLGYTPGFVASAALVLLQSSIYTAAVARRAGPAAIFGVMLAGVFGFLYVLLSLESYALLTGALALFVVLSMLMVLTQRVRRNGTEEVS